MVLADLIRRALDVALSGSNPDSNVLQAMSLEAEVLAEQALDELAVEIAENRELRARLEKQFSVTLVNGVGALPAGVLVEYLREGSVRDSDIGANSFGNNLARVLHINDFLGFLPVAFGYYCVVNNQIRTRAISSGDFTATVSPLIIDAPFIPTKASMNAEVPTEIETTLVDILAVKLRGLIARMPAPATK